MSSVLDKVMSVVLASIVSKNQPLLLVDEV